VLAPPPEPSKAGGEIAVSKQPRGKNTMSPPEVERFINSPSRYLRTTGGTSGLASPPREDAQGDPAVLARRVQELEKELAAARAEIADAVGKPIEAPPDLPDRFKEKALLEALQTAVKQTNPTAEVTSIDCTEYPCITYIKGLGIQQFQSLKSNPAMQIYAQDSVNVIKWGDLGGFIATPKTDPSAIASPERNAAQQRIMVRLQQMAAASNEH
jgi:hypothetical protein